MGTRPKQIKPKRFNKNVPHLPVKNLRSTLDYYHDKLNFIDEWTSGDKNGGIHRDDLHLLFAENNDFTNDINKKNPRLPLMWFFDDIEALYTVFKKRHIELATDLRVHPYELKEFVFIDINGYYNRIAEKTAE